MRSKMIFVALLCQLGYSVHATRLASTQPIDTPPDTCDVSLPCSTNSGELCPPGLFCKDGRCVCGKHYPHNIIHCTGTSSSVLRRYCVTFDEHKNLILAGACIYPLVNKSRGQFPNIDLYRELPRNVSQLNSHTCNSTRRAGALCGRCQHDYYPQAYSFNVTCVPCLQSHFRKNVLQYLLAAFLPLTLFYFIIVFFKVSIFSTHFYAVVYYCQTVSLPNYARLYFSVTVSNNDADYITVAKVLFSLYGVWNLDFFRPFYSHLCLRMGILPTLAMDYVVAVYPLLLVTVTYILIVLYDRNCKLVTVMWTPFRVLFSLLRRQWDIKASVIDAFTMFFFLSSVKLLSVSFDLLTPTRVYQLYPNHTNYTLGLFYAGDIAYFGKEHLPYGILAVFVLFVSVLLPVTILLVYLFTQGLFSNRFSILHTFADLLQGNYKDGTQQGDTDYRWFSATYLIIRLILFSLLSMSDKVVALSIFSAVLIFFTILIAMLQPYKFNAHNVISIVLMQFLTLFFVVINAISFAEVMAPRHVKIFYVLGGLSLSVPLLFAAATVTVVLWVHNKRKFGLNLMTRLRAWRSGYCQLLPDRLENSVNYHKRNLASFSSAP